MTTLRGIAQPSDCFLTHMLLAYWRKLLFAGRINLRRAEPQASVYQLFVEDVLVRREVVRVHPGSKRRPLIHARGDLGFAGDRAAVPDDVTYPRNPVRVFARAVALAAAHHVRGLQTPLVPTVGECQRDSIPAAFDLNVVGKDPEPGRDGLQVRRVSRVAVVHYYLVPGS